MQIFYDLFPILIFFILYKMTGIYAATLGAMLAAVVQVAVFRFRHKRFEMMQLITLVAIVILGSATLFFHNPMFIKWKPTIINWAFAFIFTFLPLFTKRTLVEILLSHKIKLPQHVWQNLNTSWIAFFLIIGALNVIIIYHYSTNTWVNFKLFGMLGLSLLFVVGQAFYLAKHVQDHDQDDQ